MTTQTQRLPITALPCVAVAATVGSLARSFIRSFVAPAALPRHLRCVDVVVVVVVFIVASHWTRPRIGDSLLRPQPAPTVRLGDVCLDFFFFFGATSAIIKNSGIRMCAREGERGREEEGGR